MARFLITGGTGFIGSALLPRLAEAGHEAVVLTRNPGKYAGLYGETVSYIDAFDAISSDTCFQAVINLAGEGIGDKRWSEKRKQVLLSSRIDTTRQLIECLSRLETLPEVMISGSAVGWYGAQDQAPLAEDSGFHDEYTHSICWQWEEAASGVRDLGVRLCIVRLGIVLEKHGGALKRLLPPFQFCLGGPIGSGKQMMSWVHLDDVIKAINFLVNETQLEGVFNLTAPDAVKNQEFSRSLGKALSRPAVLPLPGFMVKLLFGEMGDRLLLKGQNVVPSRLLESGYDFEFNSLDDALAAIFSE